MIRLENCSRTYHMGKKNSVEVLRDINFEINQGEMLAIMGKSGAGKTTLLNLIGLIDVPTEGKVYFNDSVISPASDKKRSQFRADHIGFILQSYGLLLEESVERNIMLPTAFSTKKPSDMNQFKDVVSWCGLDQLLKQKTKELSGGQMQRVAIARALITKPDIILADEPTGSLDSQSSGEIMQQLIDLNRQGTTILVVTHDQDVAAACQRTIYIKNGQISDRP